MKAIFRINKIKSEKVLDNWKSHNFRERFQQNIKKEYSYKNKIFMDTLDMKSKKASIENYYKQKKVKIKKGNVLAIDGIISMSPEFFKGKEENEIEKWATLQIEFIKENFNEVKVIILHLDEKTPHIHFLATTEKTTTKKYKNRYGTSERTTTTLNTTWLNKESLSQMQENIYTKNKEKYNEIEQRTIKKQEQIKRNHIPLKEYYASIANERDRLNEENKLLKEENKKLIKEKMKLESELQTEKLITNTNIKQRMFHVKHSP